MFVEILNREINYECFGKGIPIVFVHGWGGNLNSLKKIAKIISKNYKCYILDLPGFGKSSNPGKDWGVEEYACVLEKFIQKNIGQKALYCGHSFGGGLGIYLSRNTDLINKMVLIAPAYRRKNLQKTSFSKNSIYVKLKKYILPIRKIFYRVFFPSSQVLAFPHLEENFKKIISQDLTDLITDIDVETLILWGKEDTFVNIKDGFFLNKKLKNSQMKVYDKMEHDLPIIKFDELGNDILDFLDK